MSNDTPADPLAVIMTTTDVVHGGKNPTGVQGWGYTPELFPFGRHTLAPGSPPGQRADVYARHTGTYGLDLDLYKPECRKAWEASATGHLLAGQRPYIVRGAEGSQRILVVQTLEQAAAWHPFGGGLPWGEIRSAGVGPSPGSLHGKSGQLYEAVPGPVAVRYPDGQVIMTNAIWQDAGLIAALEEDGARNRDGRDTTTGDTDLPDDEGRCPKAVSWMENTARLGQATTPRGEHANKAANYVKQHDADGHHIGGLIGEVIARLPHTAEADFEGMWATAPVLAGTARVEHTCCSAYKNEEILTGMHKEARTAQEGTEQPLTLVTPGNPVFRVDNAAVAAELLREALGRGPLSGVYLRDGLLVHTPRTGEDGYVMPTPDEAASGIDHGPAQVRPVDERHIRSLVEVRYNVGKHVRVKNEAGQIEEKWVRMLFPADAARSAAGAAELGIGCPNLSHLSGVTHTPVLRHDGTVLDRPGYDPATGLLYLPPPGLTVPALPDRPDARQVADAVALIRRPVSLFPWAPHHEANWLGAMMTPLMRMLLPPPYQLVVITATNAGSGKTLLMRMLGIVHGIATRGEFPRDGDELRKLFISTLHTTTAPVIGMDNIRGTIYSSELESLLTMRTLTDRELGRSRTITVTNDRLWVVTGNNARIGGDLSRRCLPVALDPRCGDPHKRAFPFDPAQWLASHRGEYIAALLTVARGWVLAGAQKADPGRSDDYAGWHASMRGMLAWAGVPGTFAEEGGDLAVVSEDDAEWGTFVRELWRVFEDEAFTTADIIKHLGEPLAPRAPAGTAPTLAGFVATSGVYVPAGVWIDPDSLPGDLAETWEKARYGKTSGFAKSLGKWLGYQDGRVTPDRMTVRMHRGRRASFTIEGAG